MRRESTNDKILRLFNEGWDAERIAQEVTIPVGSVNSILERRVEGYSEILLQKSIAANKARTAAKEEALKAEREAQEALEAKQNKYSNAPRPAVQSNVDPDDFFKSDIDGLLVGNYKKKLSEPEESVNILTKKENRNLLTGSSEEATMDDAIVPANRIMPEEAAEEAEEEVAAEEAVEEEPTEETAEEAAEASEEIEEAAEEEAEESAEEEAVEEPSEEETAEDEADEAVEEPIVESEETVMEFSPNASATEKIAMFAKAQIEENEAKIASANQQITSLNGQIEDADAQVAAVNAEIEAVKAQLEAQLAALNGQLDALGEQKVALNEQISSLNEQISVLEADNDQYRAIIK